MSGHNLQMDPTKQYPAKWFPMEFVCKCGVKCRLER
jgi:hypothetical protein